VESDLDAYLESNPLARLQVETLQAELLWCRGADRESVRQDLRRLRTLLAELAREKAQTVEG
jgi:hypothetical protein